MSDTKDLVAGRGLDFRIAEEVMGWERLPNGEHDWPPMPHWMNRAKDGGQDEYIPQTPKFSTSIADAWRVVEKLVERFHWRIQSPFTDADLWFAGVTPLGVTGWNGRPDHEVGGSSAPEAICRCALAALSTRESRKGDGE